MAAIEDINKTVKISEFIEDYDLKVYDILGSIELLEKFRPLMYLSIALYLFGIYFGQKWMKNRPPFKLDKALFLWNLGLSIFSIIATYRAYPEIAYHLSMPNRLFSAVCSGEHRNYATSFWALMFLFSKFVEFGDTAFIVLRKQKLIVLHWKRFFGASTITSRSQFQIHKLNGFLYNLCRFHHVATLLITWATYEYYDTIGRFFLLNTFVHSIMYPYYALRALKYKIPRKLAMSLTTLQIFQMFCHLYLNGYSFYKIGQGFPCSRHENVIYIIEFVIFSFAALFVIFFIRSYIMSPKKTKSQ